jgi:2-polyprenyl-6-hydroxyphenyl methylase/3-demethylubiquinone-9 3-methyltransferase
MNTEDLLSSDAHFAFGKNWIDYAKKIDEARIAQAVSDLQRLSGRKDFEGLSFLDIGCGSGLHSLAAVRMGAVRVVGVDIDADSVSASRNTLAHFAPEADTRFDVTSVFDMNQQSHGGFDLVYSWGVLHHTGDMYRALTTTASLIHPGGTFMVALYKETQFCGMWRVIKRWYSKASPKSQGRARSFYVGLQRFAHKIRGRDFDKYIQTYSKSRGMDFYNDVHDWLGGYPYESISPEDCHAFFSKHGFQLEHEAVKKLSRYHRGFFGSGCDEYTFIKCI